MSPPIVDPENPDDQGGPREMEFRLLGPIELLVAGSTVDLGPPRQRCVLAALLWSANQPVPIETLIDRLWGDTPPAQARGAMYSYLTRLRSVLGRGAPGDPPRLAKVSTGYLLSVERDRVDVLRYQDLVRRARSAQVTDRERAALCGQAIELWRDPPLAGLAGQWARTVRDGLAQQHAGTLATWAAAELAMNRHDIVVTRLSAARDRYPLAEVLVHQLMVAMTRAGRPADALAAFAEHRETLADQLGLDPGAQLRDLESEIRRAQAGVAAPGRPVPRQLPPGVSNFAGRVGELAVLDALPASSDGAVAIAMVTGAGGVGKTALALRWAHRVAERFPDGQLYVNLHGFGDGEPLSASTVIDTFLRGLGVDGGAVPADLAERSALFRSLTAHRRVLVVLDNAADVAQVRPLLPGGRYCQVIITSRADLGGLIARDGARRVALDVLPEPEARELLRGIAGPARVDAEPAAADELLRLTDRLPLALRIVAERAARRPDTPLSALAAELRGEADRLDLLATEGEPATAIRAVFTCSCAGLPAEAARTFRLLGLHPGATISTDATAALCGSDRPDTERALDVLVGEHLVAEIGPDRFRTHDLVRLFAREQAEHRESAAHRTAALTRLASWYLDRVRGTLSVLRPREHRLADLAAGRGPARSFDGPNAALDWLEEERNNLAMLVARVAPEPGDRGRLGIALAHCLTGFFHLRSYWHDCVTLNEIALAAARHAGDTCGMAHCQYDIGSAKRQLGDLDAAQAQVSASLAGYRRVGNRVGEATALALLGDVLVCRGRFDEAATRLAESLEIGEQLGDEFVRAVALNNLGTCHGSRGDLDAALGCLAEALACYRACGDGRGTAACLGNLGYGYGLKADTERAAGYFDEAMEILVELGDRRMTALMLVDKGDVLHRAGRAEPARACWQRAHELLTEIGAPVADEVRDRLDGVV